MINAFTYRGFYAVSHGLRLECMKLYCRCRDGAGLRHYVTISIPENSDPTVATQAYINQLLSSKIECAWHLQYAPVDCDTWAIHTICDPAARKIALRAYLQELQET